jgi:putative transcriptional regulator
LHEEKLKRPWQACQIELLWVGKKAGKSIVNRLLTRIADYLAIKGQLFPGFCGPPCTQDEARMQRLRLKADGRIVELRDGREFPLAPMMGVSPSASIAGASVVAAPAASTALPAVRDLRRRACLTQLEFASRLGVPVETIRNWEQGKRMPRGPARALLAVIAHAPEMVFSALAKS